MYKLGYPNKEVEDSLKDALLSGYRHIFPGDSMAITNDLGEALNNNDIPKMLLALDTIIGSIPYEHWKADSESVFHIIIHLSFTRLGIDVQSEAHSSNGRCDVVVKTATHIYAIELKLNASSQKALDQIFEKNYLRPYQSDKRKKRAIGINFSSEKRAVQDYLVKEV